MDCAGEEMVIDVARSEGARRVVGGHDELLVRPVEPMADALSEHILRLRRLNNRDRVRPMRVIETVLVSLEPVGAHNRRDAERRSRERWHLAYRTPVSSIRARKAVETDMAFW